MYTSHARPHRCVHTVIDVRPRRLTASVLVFIASITTALAQGPAAVNHERMLDADAEPGNWMGHGRTYDEQRFSPLTQINEHNAHELGLAWYHDHHTFRGVQATPIVVDGVMYNISAWNITTALNAATGELLWTYDPEVPAQWARYTCCEPISRGLAVWEGKVIIATLDGRLIALDAANGEPVWETLTIDRDWPYSITGAPRVYDGRVVIGNSGADFGVRGYASAYDAETGELIWRFYTVPGNPAEGFENEAMAMAAETWTGEWWVLGGGGTPWDAFNYDPELNLVYIGTGNGAPLSRDYRSPDGGDNLFLASIVAVTADTGEYVWHYQTAPGENWDYTATQPMILADLEIHGEERKVIMQAPKNGFYYVLDRETGELLSAQKFVTNFWASHVDMLTGRPVLHPDAFFGEEPVLITPGPGGGHNWYPMSFSPLTGLAYFAVMEEWFVFALAPEFEPQRFRSNTGWTFAGYAEQRQRMQRFAAEQRAGWLTAWDPVRQREAWRVPYSRPGSGGTLVTAGNIVFQGTAEQTVAIYRADDGEKLWDMPVQTVPMAGPITYTVDGEQYIAVNAGWGGGMAAVERMSGQRMQRSEARLVVFKLGGTAELPPLLPDDSEPEPPPPITASESVIQRGATLYSEICAVCHGPRGVSANSDLRYMSRETRARFADIVLRGLLLDQGMARFDDLLDEEGVAAIYAYLVARANEDWGQPEARPADDAGAVQ